MSPLKHSRTQHICIFRLQPPRMIVTSPQSTCTASAGSYDSSTKIVDVAAKFRHGPPYIGITVVKTTLCLLRSVFSIISDLFINFHCCCNFLSPLYTSRSYYTGSSVLVAPFFIIIFNQTGSVLF